MFVSPRRNQSNSWMMERRCSFLVVTAGKPVVQVETKLVAKQADRPGAGAVRFPAAIFENVLQQLQVGLHLLPCPLRDGPSPAPARRKASTGWQGPARSSAAIATSPWSTNALPGTRSGCPAREKTPPQCGSNRSLRGTTRQPCPPGVARGSNKQATHRGQALPAQPGKAGSGGVRMNPASPSSTPPCSSTELQPPGSMELGKIMAQGTSVSLPQSSPPMKLPRRPNPSPTAASGATKSATCQNVRWVRRANQPAASMTPTSPPWNDMPPWLILNRNRGSSSRLSSA